MKETVSSTHAAQNLGELLARIKHRGDRFILTRNNQPIAELHAAPALRRGTFNDLVQALAFLRADPGFAGDLDKGQSNRQPTGKFMALVIDTSALVEWERQGWNTAHPECPPDTA